MNYLIDEDYLMHYGIKGMKWGVRRYQNKDGTLTNAGKKRYDEDDKTNNEKTEKSKKFKLSDKQKKAVIIGASAAAAGLAIYGGYKISKLKSGDEQYDPILGLKLKQKTTNIVNDLKNINPHYSEFDNNFNNNCGNCGLAFEMRRRGYDVQALGNPKGLRKSNLVDFFKGINDKTFKELTPDMDIINSKPSKERGVKVQEFISKQIRDSYSENASGMLFFPHKYGSHWINWVKEGSDVNFYDGQNPKIDMNQLFSLYHYYKNNSTSGLTSVRLDDLEVTSNIKKVVGNVGEVGKELMEYDQFLVRGEDFVLQKYY